jgi:hypothetical protein
MTDKQLEEIIKSNVDTNPELAGTVYSYSELMSCMKQAIEADRAERDKKLYKRIDQSKRKEFDEINQPQRRTK